VGRFYFYYLCGMPELFRFFGIRFFFFSNAKYEINPIKLIENNGMKNKDLKLAESIIEENQDIIEQKWQEYFKG
jgi:hypothetical protein